MHMDTLLRGKTNSSLDFSIYLLVSLHFLFNPLIVTYFFMNDHYICFIEFRNILNVVETMPIWHDMARKPKINLSAQYGVSVQGVAGLIEIFIDQ